MSFVLAALKVLGVGVLTIFFVNLYWKLAKLEKLPVRSPSENEKKAESKMRALSLGWYFLGMTLIGGYITIEVKTAIFSKNPIVVASVISLFVLAEQLVLWRLKDSGWLVNTLNFLAAIVMIVFAWLPTISSEPGVFVSPIVALFVFFLLPTVIGYNEIRKRELSRFRETKNQST